MPVIYYATKIDKSGNKITIGYQTAKNREKYSADAKFHDTVFYTDISDDASELVLTQFFEKSSSGNILHGMIRNNNFSAQDTPRNFVLYVQLNDKWSRTAFAFSTFSAANTAMKNLVTEYQAIAVINEGTPLKTQSTKSYNVDDLEIG